MGSPFHIDGPAVISFSGGRTSAYMLRRVLDEGIQSDVHVLFADTGKERPETYDFVRACADQWGIEIHWVERSGRFEQLISDRGLPNPVFRFCTQELKIRPMRDWMLGRGYEHWTNVVGIRADEPRRVAKMRQTAEKGTRERWDIEIPLADAGIHLTHVNSFWSSQPFDLQLRPHEGNCDLCFLKSHNKLKNIARDRPDLAEWWARQEERVGSVFRADRPSYRSMLVQPDLFKDGIDESLIECFCTD